MKLDPSRLAVDEGVLGNGVDGHGDLDGPQDSADVDDWLHVVAVVVLFAGTARYSSVVHDHKIGRCRTWSRIGKFPGEE